MKWIYLFVLMFKTSLTFVVDNKNVNIQTCEFKVTNNCNYTLSFTPEENCEKDTDPLSRMRRETESLILTRTRRDTKAVITNELLAKKIKRVQNKLTREMEQLSTRVLRGIRRIESVVSGYKENGLDLELTSGRKVCPAGFVTVDNWSTCYMISKFNTSWYDAKDYCNALNSQVVSLLTLKEHYIVTFLIRNNPDVQNAAGWWTSGTFYPKTKQWMWASDTKLSPLTYIKWAADEPNELSLQCIMLHSRDELLWHDEVCTKSFNFVCKVDI